MAIFQDLGIMRDRKQFCFPRVAGRPFPLLPISPRLDRASNWQAARFSSD
jgi:hypothetical protein